MPNYLLPPRRIYVSLVSFRSRGSSRILIHRPQVEGMSIKTLEEKTTLPKTNSSPLKIGHPKMKLVFQPSIFMCHVSFRRIHPRSLPFLPESWFSGKLPEKWKATSIGDTPIFHWTMRGRVTNIPEKLPSIPIMAFRGELAVKLHIGYFLDLPNWVSNGSVTTGVNSPFFLGFKDGTPWKVLV